MISNLAPYTSGAHIWVKYSKKSSNTHHLDTFFNKIHIISKKGRCLHTCPLLLYHFDVRLYVNTLSEIRVQKSQLSVLIPLKDIAGIYLVQDIIEGDIVAVGYDGIALLLKLIEVVHNP